MAALSNRRFSGMKTPVRSTQEECSGSLESLNKEIDNPENPKDLPSSNNLHLKIIAINKLVYKAAGISISNLIYETEGKEYAACFFTANNLHVRSRVAKTTPTKKGQFVTFWRRTYEGSIAPYDVKDELDLLVINVYENNKLGQFVFPKSILEAEKILSRDGKGGKRGMRVYAPWVKLTSIQAMKTQAWQAEFFVDLPYEVGEVDLGRIKSLYACLDTSQAL